MALVRDRIRKLDLTVLLRNGQEWSYRLRRREDGSFKARVRRRAAGVTSRVEGDEAEHEILVLLDRIPLDPDLTPHQLLNEIRAACGLRQEELAEVEVDIVLASGQELEAEWRFAGAQQPSERG
jgi:hypothetical protein